MNERISRFVLLSGSILFSLCVIEVASRFLYPVYSHATKITLDKRPVASWVTPGITYRQISSEYDVITTITEKGHRVPIVESNPDVVFLGDSFTFGLGLSDGETFESLYCEARKYVCANLAVPGTGTEEQVDRLQNFLDKWGWRPREVKIFIMAMTASFSAGNDLADNYWYGVRKENSKNNGYVLGDRTTAQQELSNIGVLERLVNTRGVFLEHSNLVRIGKLFWGPWLRNVLDPGLDERRLKRALDLTHLQLVRFDEMSRKYRFTYAIYLLHPVQDILRGSYVDTFTQLNKISPSTIRDPATLFELNPEQYYYPYDGHMNKKGSMRIANFLLSE
jgi:hypothetical protein